MDPDVHNRDFEPAPDRQQVGMAALWSRAARLAFAILCIVAASLSGSTAGRVAPAQIGAGVDHQRDTARDLLRPQAEVVGASAKWRSVDPTDRRPDPHAHGALERRPTVLWIAGSAVSSDTWLDQEPHGLVVRAGSSRAPPMVIGRPRTFA
jgi:hypothetical protein